MKMLRWLLVLVASLQLVGCTTSHLSGRTVNAGLATVDRLLVIYEPKSFHATTVNGQVAAGLAASTLGQMVPQLQARLPVVLGAQGIPTRMVAAPASAQPEPGEKVLRIAADAVLMSGAHTVFLHAQLEDPARGATMWVGRLLVGRNGFVQFDEAAADKIAMQLVEQWQRQSLLARRSAPATAIAVAPAAMPVVPASGYAQIDDVDAVPYLNDRGRQVYRDWLRMPTPRAFALSPDGHYSFTTGLRGLDATLPSDPVDRAMVVCARAASVPCKLYAVNGAVVWVK